MNLGNLLKAQESGIIGKLDEAGIATVSSISVRIQRQIPCPACN
ncbi:hypothetical protein [Pontivivens nitratireducens]|nr:hypothetical protein [Pontibrevibacter nitratireducens]